MNILEDLGIPSIVNANATLTRLGGSRMWPEVIAAMAEVSGHFVDLHLLQRRVGERIAALTRNEAAYVCTGAAAGLTLATAACVTGTDPDAIARLPDTAGLKNEVIVHHCHRNGYDRAVRLTGVRLVEIGDISGATESQLEAAFTSRTAAFVWFQGEMNTAGEIPIERVIAIAAEHGVPVLVDAAAQLPPVENFWRYTTEMGAALATFSGGKDLRGPQSSGLIVGRRDLIEACRLNGSPLHAIGRPMKVSKEEMVGLMVAIERYLTLDYPSRLARDERIVAEWCAVLNQLPGARAERSFPNEAGQPLPRAWVTFDPADTGIDRDTVVMRLASGSPPVSVWVDRENGFYLNPMTLEDNETEIVLQQLLAVLHRGGK